MTAGLGHGRPDGRLRRPPARQLVASPAAPDRKSTRLNSSHANISYAVFCLKKKKQPLAVSTYVRCPVFRRYESLSKKHTYELHSLLYISFLLLLSTHIIYASLTAVMHIFEV